jgi:hypothetical protein
MSDRILVLHEGQVTAEIARGDATEERIMFAATGQVEPPDVPLPTGLAFAQVASSPTSSEATDVR